MLAYYCTEAYKAMSFFLLLPVFRRIKLCAGVLCREMHQNAFGGQEPIGDGQYSLPFHSSLRLPGQRERGMEGKGRAVLRR